MGTEGSFVKKGPWISIFECYRPDEFGLRGLLQNIQATHYSRIRRKHPSDPYESTVISREDLGFSDEVIRFHGPKLLPHFESPFNSKLNTLYLDHDVPEEYYTAWKLSGCLKGKWSHYLPTDLLFFLFYTAVGDILQLEAAAKLFDRGWRFLKVSASFKWVGLLLARPKF